MKECNMRKRIVWFYNGEYNYWMRWVNFCGLLILYIPFCQAKEKNQQILCSRCSEEIQLRHYDEHQKNEVSFLFALLSFWPSICSVLIEWFFVQTLTVPLAKFQDSAKMGKVSVHVSHIILCSIIYVLTVIPSTSSIGNDYTTTIIIVPPKSGIA